MSSGPDHPPCAPVEPEAAIDASTLRTAVELLNQGRLVAFPTETVYGLGADAENPVALRRIFEAKGRPSSHPLILHVAHFDQVRELVTALPPEAELLARLFWPGPLTLVLKKSSRVLSALTGGQDTVAVRVPGHAVALALLQAFGRGIAAPSANRFGAISPTTAQHVRADLGARVDLVLDGGACRVGLESTILDLSRGAPVILRPGGITAEALQNALGRSVNQERASSIRAPGQLASHYAPSAELLMVAASELGPRAEALQQRGARVAVLHRDDMLPPRVARTLAVPHQIEGFAHTLYAALRELDQPDVDVILAVAPEGQGLGEAVLDRLTRAAAPRLRGEETPKSSPIDRVSLLD
ncbi:MAG TPA: L-threonylcarbamoyladenylate synthase [Polyangiaceae bacterium]|nr:L-threonylcarbamoyladenylate synthase [Polyangiaceae bacterium]